MKRKNLITLIFVFLATTSLLFSSSPAALAQEKISIKLTANPLILEKDGGEVKYTYEVKNLGANSLSDIFIFDDVCDSGIKLDSGDANNNEILEKNETWIYSCTADIIETTANVAGVTGLDSSGDKEVSDTDTVTVTVKPQESPLEIAVEVDKNSLPLNGGSVIFTYTVINLGTVPIGNIAVADNKCSEIKYVSGDANRDGKLDVDEDWKYRCSTLIKQSTVNSVTAKGTINELTISDAASATISVEKSAVPKKLPKAGGGASYYEDMLNSALIAFAFLVIFALIFFKLMSVAKKR